MGCICTGKAACMHMIPLDERGTMAKSWLFRRVKNENMERKEKMLVIQKSEEDIANNGM
jgi:hypothetical protein